MKAKKSAKLLLGKKSRKQLRKEQRQQKKVRRNEYYTNRKKPGAFVLRPPDDDDQPQKNTAKNNQPKQKSNVEKTEGKVKNRTKSIDYAAQQKKDVDKEKREQQRLQSQMQKQRKKQLMKANEEEDKTIKKLAKQLKLNKRKSKSIPKSFTEDGLDYLLEVCDEENLKNIVSAEKNLNEADSEFEEDFALMTTQKPTLNKKKKIKEQEQSDSENLEDVESEDISNRDDESEGEFEDFLNQDDESEDDFEESDNSEDDNEDDELYSDHSSNNGIAPESKTEKSNKRKRQEKDMTKKTLENAKKKPDNSKKLKIVEDEDNFSEDSDVWESLKKNSVPLKSTTKNQDDESGEENEESSEINDAKEKTCNADGTWEDIYGRLRDQDGNVITQTETKYIPPAVRAKMEAGLPEDKKRIEKLNRLKRQLKGLLNRLAESNMHNISSQIEDIYMNNSRYETNDALTSLILEALISNVKTPERLLMEHVLLITVLHANVGTEVGAHFLQTVIRKFNDFEKDMGLDDKKLDNVVCIIAQLYNFKLFHSQLLYQVIKRLAEDFSERNVESILSILKSVGFTLRKDDPIALKELITDLQKKAANASEESKDNPRVKFMLEILLAVKNNNMNKIPNYDTSYSEHLKKIMKGFIRKGNYVTQLNISLDDLLKADERGKWWVVGSAWTGKSDENEKKSTDKNKEGYSQKLLELARLQRMNTDARRNIFCIIMSAEDYLDAFEKLLHIGLKNQQEREIINVLLHCCLQEKQYNPYYSFLAQKFCDYDRRFQMIIKYSIWDKLKALTDCSGVQISNLAKLLTQLFLEKGLPISILKVVQFGDLDKVTLRFVRQILLGVLLHEDVEQCQEVFLRVAHSDKLKQLRERLRLFVHHFLLRNIKEGSLDEKQKNLLEERAKIVERILTMSDKKTRF